MQRLPSFVAAVALLLGAPAALLAQDQTAAHRRQHRRRGELAAHRRPRSSAPPGIVVHQPINYRDIQRAITALFKTGQFDDVVAEQRTTGDRLILVLKVKERPVLEKWAVRGVSRSGGGRGQGPGEARRRPADRPERRRAGPRGHRLALQARRLLRRPGQDARGPADRRASASSSTCEEGAARGHQPGGRGRQQALLGQGRSSSTWPPVPKGSGGSRRASTTSGRSTRTCASGCRAGTPTRDSSISR